MLQNLIDRTDSMFACLAHNFLTSVYFTRHEQCQAYNGNNFNIEGLPPDVKWVPKYTGSKFQNVTWLNMNIKTILTVKNFIFYEI